MWTVPLADSLPAPLGEADFTPSHGASPNASSDPDHRNLPRILLVDDDPFMLGIQSRMLRSMGYDKVGAASTAAAALRMLKEAPRAVDLIICDLNMPGMDGIEFLQILNAGTFRGSIVLLSGEGARIMHTVQKLLGHGCLSILGGLEKPAGQAALRAVLDLWKPPSGTASAKPALMVAADELHTANREEQWVLHYQPKVSLETGALAGTEALIRWIHPKHGLVFPDNFIGVAEECGAIDAMTDWVLLRSMKQLAAWHTGRLPIGMAVNVSMDNLRARGFVRRVRTLARDNGISPQNLTLEITESRLMSPSPVPMENLVRLRMQRFGLSIDDFGTGHSSLAQLRDVPFSELKVDRGFVQGARNNQIIRPMLDGSIGIAKRLGMQVVAEGVETEDDWHLLREIGCDLAQGYFIGRPMPADRIPEWLDTWQARQAHLVE